jgi:hypothetical protein
MSYASLGGMARAASGARAPGDAAADVETCRDLVTVFVNLVTRSASSTSVTPPSVHPNDDSSPPPMMTAGRTSPMQANTASSSLVARWSDLVADLVEGGCSEPVAHIVSSLTRAVEHIAVISGPGAGTPNETGSRARFFERRGLRSAPRADEPGATLAPTPPPQHVIHSGDGAVRHPLPMIVGGSLLTVVPPPPPAAPPANGAPRPVRAVSPQQIIFAAPLPPDSTGSSGSNPLRDDDGGIGTPTRTAIVSGDSRGRSRTGLGTAAPKESALEGGLDARDCEGFRLE